MKYFCIFLLSLFIFQSTFNISAQNKDLEERKQFYWFTVSAKYIKHKETKQKVLTVEEVEPEILSGTFAEYEAAFGKDLKKNKICVGPYHSEEFAAKAQKFFNIGNLGFDEADNFIASITDTVDTYYFYITNPVQDGNSKNFTFQRIPARIASGSILEFVQILYESSMFNKLAIGPFNNHLTAEKSKYIFRKYGELSYEGQNIDQNKLDTLKIMAEKWKNLEIKNYIAIEEDVSAGNVKFEFPKYYFNEDVIQQVTFGVTYKNRKTYATEGTSFQGELVQDNNGIVPFANGRKVKYAFTLPEGSSEDIYKIFIRSTLFSNTVMLNCEDRVIYVNEK